MQADNGIFIVNSSGGAAVDAAILRTVRGNMFQSMDLRFVVIAVLSIGLHVFAIWYLRSIKIQAQETMTIEQIPERIAKLLVDKPMPKPEAVKPKMPTTVQTNENTRPIADDVPSDNAAGQKPTTREQVVARKNVAKRDARVEEKVRSVGVLGMLTGVGTTARGPAVVDVLSSMGARKESNQNLDAAMANVTGLQQTQNINVLQKTLVKSKEVTINRREEIDDLIAGIGSARTVELAKRGTITIQRPESIEGAGSQSAKRDFQAINAVVLAHKSGINMSYEKYLKSDPALAGKLTVRFTIGSGGSVTDVQIVENTTGNNDLAQEIARKIRMWTFEPVPEGDATVTFPFIFSPAQGQG